VEYQPPTGAVRKAANGAGHHIVGREGERKELRRAFDLAQEGHGGIVSVTGDAGLGKTALVDNFLDGLVQDGQAFHLARGGCSESFIENQPFMPWIEALGVLANEPALSGVMRKTAPAWHREISHQSSGAPQRMKRELLDFCRQVSTVHPLIIVIDDFHWADAGSADLLAFLATRLKGTRTMVVPCYRLAEMKIKAHPFLQLRSDLLSRSACTEIPLNLLDREDVAEHLALEYPNGKFPNDYAAFLHAKTDGHPLLMRAAARGPASVSGAIQNMIETKMRRLDDTHRQLLVTASVQGREFDSAVLATSMQMGYADVEDTLQELDEVHGLIQRIREEQLPDGKFTVRYRFVYAVYQEACYASLNPTRKATLNASLADALLTYYGN